MDIYAIMSIVNIMLYY